MNKIFGSKYDYLSLSASQVAPIQHSQNYIKEGTGEKAIRKIYSNQQFDQFEQDALANLKRQLNGVASHYSNELLYRFLYSYKFKLEDTIKGIKAHEVWLNDPNTFKITAKSQEFLDKGIIYLGGRDKQLRPSVVIQAGLIDPKTMTAVDFMAAMNTVFMIAQQYMFYPGKVENWIIIIDTMEVGITGLPFDMLKLIIQTAAAHYVGNLERLYLMNPSTSLSFSWGIISAFIDERSNKKIQNIKAKELHKLKEQFNEDQIEQKFGGKLPNITQFWPPQSTLQQVEKEPSLASSKRNPAPFQQNYQGYQAPYKRISQDMRIETDFNKNKTIQTNNNISNQNSVTLMNNQLSNSKFGEQTNNYNGVSNANTVSRNYQNQNGQETSFQNSQQFQSRRQSGHIQNEEIFQFQQKQQNNDTSLQQNSTHNPIEDSKYTSGFPQVAIVNPQDISRQRMNNTYAKFDNPVHNTTFNMDGRQSSQQPERVSILNRITDIPPQNTINSTKYNEYQKQSYQTNDYQALKSADNNTFGHNESFDQQKVRLYSQSDLPKFNLNTIQEEPVAPNMQNSNLTQQEDLNRSKRIEQTQQSVIRNQDQVTVSQRIFCMQARDSKYTACSIF